MFTQTLPYLPLGGAALGVLGSVAATWAERQIASNVVDAILALLLASYGIYELSAVPSGQEGARGIRPDRARRRPSRRRPHVDVKATTAGLVPYGLIGSPTNLTDIPFVIAIGQRIGSSPVVVPMKIVAFLTALVMIMLPGWLPILLARRVRGRQRVMGRFAKALTTINRVVTVIVCLIGSGVLFYLALT